MAQKHNTHKQSGYGQVIIVGIVLAALTVVELIMALNHWGAPSLLLVASVKAVLVIYFFMHVSRLWTAEGEH